MLAMRAISKEALPAAIAETLNRTADATTRRAKRNVERRLTVRTKYTLSSFSSKRARPYEALNKAMGYNIDRMFSRAGTFSPYLWKQEDNTTVKSISGGPLPIPTEAARTSNSMSRPVSKRHRLEPTQSLAPGAIDDNKKFIGVPRGGNRPFGMYLRKNNNKRLVMLRNLDQKEVSIQGVDFFKDALRRFGTAQFIRAQFYKVAKRKLRRHQ
jgi:hypothetical protein